MTSKIALAVALVVSLGFAVSAPAAAQTPKPRQNPKPADFTVAVDGLIVADFSARITAYAELRRSLEEGLPGLVVTANHNEIRRAEEALECPDDLRPVRLLRDLKLLQ